MLETAIDLSFYMSALYSAIRPGSLDSQSHRAILLIAHAYCNQAAPPIPDFLFCVGNVGNDRRDDRSVTAPPLLQFRFSSGRVPRAGPLGDKS
jgi:hypothetical protein